MDTISEYMIDTDITHSDKHRFGNTIRIKTAIQTCVWGCHISIINIVILIKVLIVMKRMETSMCAWICCISIIIIIFIIKIIVIFIIKIVIKMKSRRMVTTTWTCAWICQVSQRRPTKTSFSISLARSPLVPLPITLALPLPLSHSIYWHAIRVFLGNA